MDHHIGGKMIIHDPKHYKGNQSHGMPELPADDTSIKRDTMEFRGNEFRGEKHQGCVCNSIENISN